jgi:Right handed beta helix region
MACSVINCTLFTVVLAVSAQARTLEVGEHSEFKLPSAAAASAHDGDHVSINPGDYLDCAVWTANRLVVEGVGDPAKVVVTDKACQGKALFVTVGDAITIRNLTLTRARVPDGNGAGIRGEGKDLMVDGVRFINNQNGILSGTIGGSMVVRNSVFDRNGACDSACAHGLYVGNLDLLQVERTRFIGTKQGHHIKSRARRTEVTGCTIEDGQDGTASYEVEMPNGGAVLVRGNVIEKGPRAENHAGAIVIGAEGVTQKTGEITIENNSFRNDGAWRTVFVINQTATEAMLRGNQLSGPVQPLRGDGQVIGGR